VLEGLGIAHSMSEELSLVGEQKLVERGHARLLVQVVLMTSCFLVLLGLPFVNKYLFNELIPKLPGAAALTPTVVMLFGATGILCCALTIEKLITRRPLSFSTSHFVLFIVPALIYAAVMGLTNTSLSMTSVNLHVLLRMSMIVWTVLFAFLVERERPSLLALLCCVVLTGGSICASWDPSRSVSLSGNESAVAAFVLTFLSAVAQGALLVFTRRAARVLGTKATLELTAFKSEIVLSFVLCFLNCVHSRTLVAGLVLLPLALGLDQGGFARFSSASSLGVGLLLLGVLVTALFQALLVAVQSVAMVQNKKQQKTTNPKSNVFLGDNSRRAVSGGCRASGCCCCGLCVARLGLFNGCFVYV
jgi:drug/metabolite transporter (DMT)-like permease